MVTERTNTSALNLPSEGHYEIAMIADIKKKKVKEVYTIYDFSFSTLLNGKEYAFKIGFFPSQMTELLRAVGAKEVAKDDFEWDMEQVIGTNLSFNLVHVADTKGNIRPTLADVKIAEPKINNNPGGITSPDEIQWKD